MRFELTYSHEIGAWTLESHGVVMATYTDVMEWRRSLEPRLAALPPPRQPLLVDVSEMVIELRALEAYADATQDLLHGYLAAIFRYGRPPGFTSTVIRLASSRYKLRANLFDDRAQAIAALRHWRAGGEILGDTVVE